MKGVFLYRFIFLVALLSIIYIVQRFWFLRAWRLAAMSAEPSRSYLFHGVVITTAAVVLATVLDPGNAGATSWFDRAKHLSVMIGSNKLRPSGGSDWC